MTEPTPTTENPPGASRWPKALIVITIFLPMLLAYLIYQTGVGVPSTTLNLGTLLQPPVQFLQLPLTGAKERPLEMTQLPKKWRLVVPVFGDCATTCKEALYVTRQVHTRLNEKYPRVERWLVTDQLDRPWVADVLQRYPQLQPVQVSATDWQALLAGGNYREADYLMMDQEGFLMMFYRVDQHTGNDLLKDLKRMLKFTREH